MKLWTMLAGLALAGFLASSAFAQGDAPQKGKGKGKRGAFAVTTDDLKAAGATDTVNQETYKKAALAKMKAARPDMTDDQATQAGTRAEGRWAAIFKAAKTKTGDDPKTGTIKLADYDDAVKAVPPRGRRGGGDKKAPTT